MTTYIKSRQEVYEAINSERDYQDRVWGNELSGQREAPQGQGGNRTTDEFILYIQGYVNDLVQIGSHSPVESDKLEFVRKVAGLCVACMEQHGAPHRNG